MEGLIDVCFALLPHSLILDWAGPAEALRIANRHLVAQGRPARCKLHFVGPLPPYASLSRAWVVVVGQPGDAIDVQTPEAQDLLHWLRGLRLHAGQLELLTVCAGSVIAAHAGLLVGRRATSHHQHLDELARTEPRCDVVANRVFVEDGAVFSSAGVTTGIDLFLHRISAVCGPAVAAGFSSDTQLRRAWYQFGLAGTPAGKGSR